MPPSPCYFFKNSWEFFPVQDVNDVPPLVRGIYVLFRKGAGKHLDVVYVGLARGEKSGAKGRLIAHRKNKPDLWTHFSVFEVWDNISNAQVEELEGLFRHIYRFDSRANELNIQKRHKPLLKIKRKTFDVPQ